MPLTPTRLSPIDLALVAAYLIAITLFGLSFRTKASGDKSLKSYFLANNTIPWWAIALSIVSAETSTLTIVSIPGVAFAGDFGFLQVVLGYMLGRIVVAALFLPKYFAGSMLTAYQLIDQRFGHTLHKVTAGLFLLTRAAAEGVRVFAISIVVSLAIGTGDTLSIGLISLLTLLYTFEGGMAAVIWTDVVQMGLYVAGTGIALITLAHHIPGGTAHFLAAAQQAHKFHMLDFSLTLTRSYTFWAGVLGGTFLTMASHGTDQLMVQRMLAARSLRESRLALLSSGAVIFLQFTLFLLIGAGLYVFYGPHPTQTFRTNDYIFPTFIVREMPHGIAGLLIAAILAAAMSNLSAALNSLASTTIIDFYVPFKTRKALGAPSFAALAKGGVSSEARPHSSTQATDSPMPHSSQSLRDEWVSPTTAPTLNTTTLSRLATVFWAIVLFAIATYAVHSGGKGHVVETGLSIASVAYGCLLGVFLLGTLTRYATELGATLGMLCGFLLNVFLYQATFPHPLIPLPIRIAFTWYVLIGSVATFALGSLFSLMRPRHVAAAALVVLTLGCPLITQAQASSIVGSVPPKQSLDFTEVSTLIQQAIADHKLPGAVVLIGHNGHIVFHHAYGNRALEPTVEAMTEDTLFDMASLTKVLVTTTAILQLNEQHKLALDTPVATYLPAFAANGKEKITIRQLLTHYSGLPEDVDLKDPWGLAAPDKAEGIRRALAAVPYSPPGVTFKYSDINFITLGALVESISGQGLDTYARDHIFLPLGIPQTAYHPFNSTCGPALRTGAAIAPGPRPIGRIGVTCPVGTWSPYASVPNTAPTAHDNEGTPATNPNFDRILRGTVHDPTTRRMGGVAGHAGVFSTAADMALFCQALLDKLTKNNGPFPLTQASLKLATTPNQPATASNQATIFTQSGDTLKGTAVRGLGWDLNSPFSRPRGTLFPLGQSFGHTGFTGTSLWLDPTSETYVILLANSIHPHAGPNISPLRGQVATAAARALDLCPGCPIPSDLSGKLGVASEARPLSPTPPQKPVIPSEGQSPKPRDPEGAIPAPIFRTSSTDPSLRPLPVLAHQTLTGIDVLEQTHYAALQTLAQRHNGHATIALLTNQAGQDAQGHRTIDLLAQALPNITLKTIFTPEHGLLAQQDTEHLTAETDPTTHIPVISIFGPKPSDKRPKPADLEAVDAVVIDLQDAGVRFWTYETLVGYFLEAASKTHTELLLLDRPNPLGGLAVQGPISDPEVDSNINYAPIPVRHGLTLGELARFYNRGLNGPLTVVPMQQWQRTEFFADTGLPWINPSPNLRSPNAALLYPAIALLETTNVSVGRGGASDPFTNLGAPWLIPADLIALLNARNIPGVAFTPTTLTIAEDSNHYPAHGQTIPAIHFTVTDPTALDSPELGLELLSALHHLYPTQFQLARAKTILASAQTLAALQANLDPRTIAAANLKQDQTFQEETRPYRLYP